MTGACHIATRKLTGCGGGRMTGGGSCCCCCCCWTGGGRTGGGLITGGGLTGGAVVTADTLSDITQCAPISQAEVARLTAHCHQTLSRHCARLILCHLTTQAMVNGWTA